MSTSIKYLRAYLHLPDGNRRPIGHLSQYGDILRVSFDPSYIHDPARPLLSLSYTARSEPETQAILSAQRDHRVARSDGHWPAYFQNLLPESHNRTRLARERGCREEDEFELLAAAGHDLMGALEVEPVSPQEGIPDAVRHWHTALGLDVLEPGFVEFPVADAAALPGVVDKFSAVRDGRRYIVKRHGQAGSYILKLPTTRHPDLVANEHIGYRLAQALGLDCAQATVISREEAELPGHLAFPDVLAVKRFDRQVVDGQLRRVHFEEFAQVLGYEPRHKYGKGLQHDYSKMAGVLEQLSGDPVRDLLEFVRRLAAFILMGNTDAHLKNWGLLYRDGRTPTLAPLYDPVCVTAFFEAASPADHAVNRQIDMAVSTLTQADLMDALHAARLPLRRMGQLRRAIADAVAQAQADWPAILAEAPDNLRRAVQKRLEGGVALTA